MCVSMFMEYAFTSTVNLALVPLHPESPVTEEGNGHVASFTLFSKTKSLD